MAKSELKTVAIRVMVTPREHANIKVAAKADARSVSSWVGLLVRERLARKP